MGAYTASQASGGEMGKLITDKPWDAISGAAVPSASAHVAVAYFSGGGAGLLSLKAGSILVVDASLATVASGSTNPFTLEKLVQAGVHVFSFRDLHAKVFAFDDVGYVGSTNASANSAGKLLEAVYMTKSKTDLMAIRDFVTSIAINRLDAAKLALLKAAYKPPKIRKLSKGQAAVSALLMDLTNEQGGKRKTQVQPPAAVWETFFGLSPTGALPVLTMTGPHGVHARPVVKHKKVRTIEVPEAGDPLPAIFECSRTGNNSYSYRVLRPGDPHYAALDAALSTVVNPLQAAGTRRWGLV